MLLLESRHSTAQPGALILLDIVINPTTFLVAENSSYNISLSKYYTPCLRKKQAKLFLL